VEGLKIDADGNVVYEDWKLNEIIFKGKDVFNLMSDYYRAWFLFRKLL